MRKNILLTGRPGVGKTTVIRRTAEQLRSWRVCGFYTQELRQGGRRTGFEVMTMDGQEGRLAEVGLSSPHQVGRYGVDLESFERLALPALSVPEADLVIIDEIGKMECFSLAFQQAVRRALDGSVPVLGTVGLGGGPFMREIRSRGDLQLLEVTRASRTELPIRLVQKLMDTRGERT
jgi:nucleoside-triphosphatase THEP1